MKVENGDIGLIGLGANSTLHYLSEFNRYYHQAHGGYSTCPLTLMQVDFNTINPHLPDQFTALIPRMEKVLRTYLEHPAKRLVVPNITLHETLDQMDKDMIDSVNLVHPVPLVVGALKKRACKQVLVLGTRYSMQSNYLRGALQKEGFTVVEASTSQIEKADLLRKAVYESGVAADVLLAFQTLLKSVDPETVCVIACTELSMLAPVEQEGVLDMADLQIRAALGD